MVARTDLGRPQRVVVAGHLDTVPVNDNWPSTRDGEMLWGLGTCDMKGGDAVILKLAATVPEPVHDVTYLLYEAEEIDSAYNGLELLSQSRPDLLEADFAILMEPSDAVVEAGCQGTLRVAVTTTGARAHSARSWRGENAIHKAGPILARLAAYDARRPVIDGLTYHEGLNATAITGGVAGNVVPDACRVEVNHRFAPDRDPAEAEAFVREFFEGYDVELLDAAPGARPGPRRARPPRRSSRRSAARSTRSSAGPTSPASAPSASRPSTTGRATRCSPTTRTSTCRSPSSWSASGGCGPGSPGPTREPAPSGPGRGEAPRP